METAKNVDWEKEADKYCEEMNGDYHKARIGNILKLIPNKLYTPGNKIFDFGSGDGFLFDYFLKAGAMISGCDISSVMVKVADKTYPGLTELGGVEVLENISGESVDAVLSFNVLAYLSDEDDKKFYEESYRILKRGGYLIVTHSNELFDMYTLNAYTIRFFKKYFDNDVSDILNDYDIKPHKIRENPLSYKYKLEEYGFKETSQIFTTKHSIIPLKGGFPKRFENTTEVENINKWKLMFQCSEFGSCSVKI